MSTLKIWVAFSAVLLATPAVSGRMDSAQEFVEDYSRTSGDALHKIFIQGMIEGFSWSTTYLEAVRKEKGSYCPPPKMILTADQVLESLRREIQEDKSLGKKPVGYAVFQTLQRVFPCK